MGVLTTTPNEIVSPIYQKTACDPHRTGKADFWFSGRVE